jgi:hypothetical protein
MHGQVVDRSVSPSFISVQVPNITHRSKLPSSTIETPLLSLLATSPHTLQSSKTRQLKRSMQPNHYYQCSLGSSLDHYSNDRNNKSKDGCNTDGIQEPSFHPRVW